MSKVVEPPRKIPQFCGIKQVNNHFTNDKYHITSTTFTQRRRDHISLRVDGHSELYLVVCGHKGQLEHTRPTHMTAKIYLVLAPIWAIWLGARWLRKRS
jgi:hypothetical protein